MSACLKGHRRGSAETDTVIAGDVNGSLQFPYNVCDFEYYPGIARCLNGSQAGPSRTI